VQAVLAEVRRLNAEAVEAAQQEAQLLAERDAAIADASQIQDDINKIEEEKAGLAAALDDVMHGAYYERGMARAKAKAAEREVRQCFSVGVFCRAAAAHQSGGAPCLAGSVQ